MKNIRELRGQEIASRILNHYLQNSVPPLLIFHGPEGTGKWSAAEAFIQQRLCYVGTGCDNCTSCKKVLNRNHPDFVQFPDDRVNIGDPAKPEPFTIRWLLKTRICFSPHESQERFILFPRADLIQHEAESALLKTLEEPPQHTRFIFLVRDLADLKPTIVSRGFAVPFQCLSQDEIKSVAEIPDEYIELLGGSFHLLPFFSTELFKKMIEKIKTGLNHPLALLQLEKWIIAGEKKAFSELLDSNEYKYNQILDIFSLLLLKEVKNQQRSAELISTIFNFKRELHLEFSGLHSYLIGELFHCLGEYLFHHRATENTESFLL